MAEPLRALTWALGWGSLVFEEWPHCLAVVAARLASGSGETAEEARTEAVLASGLACLE